MERLGVQCEAKAKRCYDMANETYTVLLCKYSPTTAAAAGDAAKARVMTAAVLRAVSSTWRREAHLIKHRAEASDIAKSSTKAA